MVGNGRSSCTYRQLSTTTGLRGGADEDDRRAGAAGGGAALPLLRVAALEVGWRTPPLAEPEAEFAGILGKTLCAFGRSVELSTSAPTRTSYLTAHSAMQNVQ